MIGSRNHGPLKARARSTAKMSSVVFRNGSSEILSGPEGQRGGLEIVFNQQLTRLGITSLAASLPQAERQHVRACLFYLQNVDCSF